MDEATFLERIHQHTGDVDVDLPLAIDATLSSLSELCPPELLRRIAAVLPLRFATTLGPREPDRMAGSASLVHREVARRTGLALGHAIEITEAVCEVIGGELDDEVRTMARLRLSPSVALLLTVPERRPPRLTPRPTHPVHTLSQGAPQAAHPLASSIPIVREEHQDRLSTAHGTRQEESSETLASGKPQVRRPT